MAAEHKDIKVAKITAYQAVAVAVITTFGGALAGYFASGIGDKKEAYRQEWIVLKNVEYTGQRMGGDVGRPPRIIGAANKYRIIIKVDNVTYSYPSTAVWQDLAVHNPEQRFPLERKTEPRKISFEVLYTTESGSNVERATSTELQQITAAPYSGTYRALGTRADDGTRSGSTGSKGVFNIQYEVRKDF